MSTYAEFESFCALVVTLAYLAEVKWVGWSHEIVHTISNTGIILGQCLWVVPLQVNPTPFPEVGYLPLERKREISL